MEVYGSLGNHWCPNCGTTVNAGGYTTKVPKLTREGVPVDAKDWTVADWKDLHEAIESVKRKIAERHDGREPHEHIQIRCPMCEGSGHLDQYPEER